MHMVLTRRTVAMMGASLPFSGSARADAAPLRPPGAAFLSSLPTLMDVAALPGLAAGIVNDGKLVWEHYAGLRDIQTRDPVTAETIFPGCSMGKPVFAWQVLRMADAGRLNLDAPLVSHLTVDGPSGDPAIRVTARDVLSQSTGFVNWRQRPDEKLASSFVPGTRFQYSGEGFYTLQRYVEKVTGVGFEYFMQQQMFEPLDMTSSTYLWRTDAPDRVSPGYDAYGRAIRRFDFNISLFGKIAASGIPLENWDHERIVRAMTTTEPPEPNGISPNVAFSLLTTLRDYAKFAACLTVPGGSLDLAQQTRKAFATPRSRVNSALSWGLGMGIEQANSRRFMWQWGDNGYWKDFVLADLATRSAVIVLTNGVNGMRVAERIVRAASGFEHPAFLWA
jgi:CubicO group peptidase (beta-lactamase class C family)